MVGNCENQRSSVLHYEFIVFYETRRQIDCPVDCCASNTTGVYVQYYYLCWCKECDNNNNNNNNNNTFL